MARSKESLTEGHQQIPAIRNEFWQNVKVTGTGAELNQQLENAGRVADFLEFGELLARDACTVRSPVEAISGLNINSGRRSQT